MTRRSLIVGATAVLVAAAVAVVVLASRGGDARLSLVPFFDVGPATLASPAPGVVDDEHVAVIPYRDGGVVRYVFALHNDGPEAAVVTEVVAPPPESETLLRPVAMGLAATGRIIGPGIGTSAGDVLNDCGSLLLIRSEPDLHGVDVIGHAPLWVLRSDQPGRGYAQDFHRVTLRVREGLRHPSVTCSIQET